MDLIKKTMDIPIMSRTQVQIEERFRSPLDSERQVGLWVDRIGMQNRSSQLNRLRKLGQYAALLIEEGGGKLYTANKGEHEIKPGDVIKIFPDEPVFYNPNHSWSEKWIVWNGPEACQLEEIGYFDKDTIITKDKLGIFLEVFIPLSEIMDKQDKVSVFDRKLMILKLISGLFRQSGLLSTDQTYSIAVKKAVEFICKNYDKDYSVSSIAERFNISESYFRTLFKDYTGTSPRRFTTSLRMSKAKELLARKFSVKKVAESVGYRDTFYFMRVFKQTTGIPPKSWQKEYLGN